MDYWPTNRERRQDAEKDRMRMSGRGLVTVYRKQDKISINKLRKEAAKAKR